MYYRYIDEQHGKDIVINLEMICGFHKNKANVVTFILDNAPSISLTFPSTEERDKAFEVLVKTVDADKAKSHVKATAPAAK